MSGFELPDVPEHTTIYTYPGPVVDISLFSKLIEVYARTVDYEKEPDGTNKKLTKDRNQPGKAGEVAVALTYGFPFNFVFRREGDGGSDFGGRIDVKSSDTPGFEGLRRLLVPKDQRVGSAEIFLFTLVDREEWLVKLVGWTYSEEYFNGKAKLYENGISEKCTEPTWVMDCDKLYPMEDLRPIVQEIIIRTYGKVLGLV